MSRFRTVLELVAFAACLLGAARAVANASR